MKLSAIPYKLQFKFPFRISHGVRTHTNVVYAKLEHEGYTAWGEAALPPYLPETTQSVSRFLNDFKEKLNSECIDDWTQELSFVQESMSAKACLDIALWNLKEQLTQKTIGQHLGINEQTFPLATYTIGVCAFEEMKLKVEYALACGFKLFKIKLNGEEDERMIQDFRNLTDLPFAVDVNQGWHNADTIMKKADWLAQYGCVLIEQPLPVNQLHQMKHIKGICCLPVYADENCQRISDIESVAECFDGVNIKLMKCGGITEAYKMIQLARKFNLKVLIGCMSESSVGCTAAATLSPLCDYADLDGPYLINNDPFNGIEVQNGRIVYNPIKQLISID